MHKHSSPPPKQSFTPQPLLNDEDDMHSRSRSSSASSDPCSSSDDVAVANRNGPLHRAQFSVQSSRAKRPQICRTSNLKRTPQPSSPNDTTHIEDGFGSASYSAPSSSDIFHSNLGLLRTVFNNHHTSLILPFLLLTPTILILFVMSTFPHWKNSLLLIAALAPVLLMVICHIIDFRSIPLQHVAVFSGMLSVGVAIFFEVAFHGAVYALFSYFQFPAFKQILVHKGKGFHITRVMTTNPAIKFLYIGSDTLFVGFIEELCKFFAPFCIYYIFMRTQQQRVSRAEKNFMYRYMWVLAVVSVCSSLGFALLENVKYVFMTAMRYEHVSLRRPVHSWWIDHMGYGNYPFLMGILVAMERAMISFPAHIMFSLCGVLGLMEFMLWKQRDQSSWMAHSRPRLSNREYHRRKIENNMHELYFISKWLLVSMLFHAAFDFLLMYTRESQITGYLGNFFVLTAHMIIPVSIYVFVSHFIKLDLSWYELVYLQVVEVDVTHKREQSKRLLSKHDDEEDADELTEGDLMGGVGGSTQKNA